MPPVAGMLMGRPAQLSPASRTLKGLAGHRVVKNSVGPHGVLPPYPVSVIKQRRMIMSFRITGLAAERFAHLFALVDAELAAQGAVRQTADAAQSRLSLPRESHDSKPATS